MIIARRPDAVTNPQFWAEDGATWFAQAYQKGGLHVLTAPYGGYVIAWARLVAWGAQAFPVGRAPLLYNLAGFALQLAPPVYIATRRFDHLIPDWRVRALLIALYLAIPASAEIDVNLTNAQWHAAVMLPLLAFALPPVRLWGRIVEGALFLLLALTGPFCLLMLPLLVWYAWARRWPLWLRVVCGLDMVAVVIQLHAIAQSAGQRRLVFGGQIPLLVRAAAGRTIVSLAVGQRGYAALVSSVRGWPLTLILTSALVVGIVILALAWLHGSLELRVFLVYGVLMLGSAFLVVPVGSSVKNQWGALAMPGLGGRYFFVPMLAVVAALGSLLGARRRAVRRAALIVVAVIVCVGVPLDWVEPHYVDYHFSTQVARCFAEPRGSPCRIPINPPGWSIEFTRQ
ncbi:MAG TPA: hypothetical protein VFW71_03500 [Actinomycetota bacterium]|nr:hypothetical protein [Actinomycetota bacterium]